MASAGIPNGAATPNTSSSLPQLTIGDKSIDLSRFQRTFFCIGPVCLRSGVGFGAGVGCGAGIGRGLPLFALDTSSGRAAGANGGTGFTLPTGMMNQIPGGYQIMNVLKTVLRKWPGSKAGAGCGVGVGYGVGIGLQYGAAGGGLGSMMGGAGGGLMGSGMGSRGGSEAGTGSGSGAGAVSGSGSGSGVDSYR